MTSPLGSAIEFLREFGLFDVILPFLLVFTLVFAILEKTKILGTENNDGKTAKKNLNAMVAFVMALIVVATNKIVNVINEALPNVILLFFLIVCFLFLISIFSKSGELDFRKAHPGWYGSFVALILIAVALIFLAAIKVSDGRNLLMYLYEELAKFEAAWPAIILVVVIIITMAVVVKSPSLKKEEA